MNIEALNSLVDNPATRMNVCIKFIFGEISILASGQSLFVAADKVQITGDARRQWPSRGWGSRARVRKIRTAGTEREKLICVPVF